MGALETESLLTLLTGRGATEDANMKILIAEDDAVSRRLLQTYLTQWGHEVTQTTNGAAAWELCEYGDFPIVISDWMMPEMDGLELVRRIRSQVRPHYIYTILLTARTQKQDVVAGMDAGADDFISKPFHYGELRVRLREGERIIRLERSLADQNRTLQETQAALVQSEKLAGLGQLAAGMAHEINNPIAFVSNNLSVLRRDVSGALRLLDLYRASRSIWEAIAPEAASEASKFEMEIDLLYLQENLGRLFDQSLHGLNRVAEIVRNLRDFARLDEAEFEESDIETCLLATIGMLNHELSAKSIRLETHLSSRRRILCHARKLNQVFHNLLLNAIQACANEGRIEVRSRSEDDCIVVEFIDDGCGIDPEQLPHVFEPFYTTKQVGQGRGLGLSVGYGIVHDHGGSISVESEVGKGSTFRVRLPREGDPVSQPVATAMTN